MWAPASGTDVLPHPNVSARLWYDALTPHMLRSVAPAGEGRSKGARMARVFVGNDAMVDRDVLDAVKRLPDDFFVFAAFITIEASVFNKPKIQSIKY